jgi:hypothetical protein
MRSRWHGQLLSSSPTEIANSFGLRLREQAPSARALSTVDRYRDFEARRPSVRRGHLSRLHGASASGSARRRSAVPRGACDHDAAPQQRAAMQQTVASHLLDRALLRLPLVVSSSGSRDPWIRSKREPKHRLAGISRSEMVRGSRGIRVGRWDSSSERSQRPVMLLICRQGPLCPIIRVRRLRGAPAMTA